MTDLEEHILQNGIALEGCARGFTRNFQRAHDEQAEKCLYQAKKILDELMVDWDSFRRNNEHS